MDKQHDELSETGVIRFQAACDLATARFVAHFIGDLKTEDPADLSQVAA
jgi:hypothetical protein